MRWELCKTPNCLETEGRTHVVTQTGLYTDGGTVIVLD